jgi:hypothetical protein
MSKRILRPPQVYGTGSKLGVGRSLFYTDYVYHGDEEFIPGTKVKRLRLVNLSTKARGVFEDEVDAVIEGLRAERDAVLS